MSRFGQGAAAALFFSVILPSAAAAQDKAPTAPATASADDWDMIRDPAKKTVAAYVSLDSGVSVILRCTNKVYAALVARLPGALGDTRVLHLSYGDHSHPETWNVVTSPTVAMSALPAPFARKLRDGGMLSIMTPDGAGPGRNLTHHLHLPASSTAVDETLTACEKPLEDPRDALLPDLGEGGLSAGVTWERPPRPNYPALARYSAGFAMLSCMALPDGRVNDCVVESEFPADGGFGRATLSSVRDARLKASDGAPITPRLIVFRTNFMMR